MLEFVFSAESFFALVALLGTHVLFATLGGIMCEKVGNLNLGLEGLMLLGASVGAVAAHSTQNPVFSISMAAVAGGFGALIYAFLTVSLKANQVVTGLTLTIFGTGFSGLYGSKIVAEPIPAAVATFFGPREIPLLSKIPFLGSIFFAQSPFVLVGVIAAVVLYLFYKKTSWGLNTRMIGENSAAADASGINVTVYKYINIVIGGLLCGIGGGFFCFAFVKQWKEGITAGAGWIAIALVIFATWKPLRAILGAYLFGTVQGLALKIQGGIPFFGQSIVIPTGFLNMLPYITTIVVLVLITIRKKREGQAPAALGVPYFREDR